jgi:hypothetical protein
MGPGDQIIGFAWLDESGWSEYAISIKTLE